LAAKFRASTLDLRLYKKLPLKVIPSSFIKKNQDSAMKNQEFVIEALKDLEANKCIERVEV